MGFISPIFTHLQSTSCLSWSFDIHFRAKEGASGAWFIPSQGRHLKQVREITSEKCLFLPLNRLQEFSWGAHMQKTALKHLKVEEANPTLELISPKICQSSSLKLFEAGNYLGYKALGGLLLQDWRVIDILETQFQWKSLHTVVILPGGSFTWFLFKRKGKVICCLLLNMVPLSNMHNPIANESDTHLNYPNALRSDTTKIYTVISV